jgi:hypothetical protein
VYNTSDSTVATVTAVDDAGTLSLSADIMTAACCISAPAVTSASLPLAEQTLRSPMWPTAPSFPFRSSASFLLAALVLPISSHYGNRNFNFYLTCLYLPEQNFTA